MRSSTCTSTGRNRSATMSNADRPGEHALRRLAVLGTGLMGTSIAMAAARAGAAVAGWDVDPAAAAGDLARFVPSHPMGGSERSGPEHAAPSVVDGIVWVLAPTEGTDPAAVEAVGGGVGGGRAPPRRGPPPPPP